MGEPKHAVLGMPGYGDMTAGASRGYWLASRASAADRPLTVTRHYRRGSLLAANFNALWCGALNLDHRGHKVDYFAMQHSDVEPPVYWLDSLVDELEASELDVLGVVVPIKDQRGLTSIALDRPDRNNWFPHARLTMREAYRLPETFTSDDLGYRLLLNTGLWVCRFDCAWAEQVHFTINDRITFDTSKGEYVANTEPEDWFFSRLCNDLGLKLGATRKIPVVHQGTAPFANDAPWGDDFDRAYVSESVVAFHVDDGFRFPADVDGWLTYAEGRAIYELARGKRVLEIGSYCGRSTICLAQSADNVVSLDPHDGRGTPRPKDTWDELHANLKRYGINNVYADRGTLDDHWPDVRRVGDARCKYEFDLIFIDGAHDLESVRSDIQNALPLLADGGLLAFHDYRSPIDPGVTKAVTELLDAGGELLSTHGTLAAVRPPAHSLAEV